MMKDDFVLIQRTLDGDEAAFSELVNKYQKWVHTLVWRKIGDFQTAEEITQDIFLKVYKKLSTLKPPMNFPGWLYVIASRQCIAWRRKKQRSTKSLDAMSTVELEELCYKHYEVEREKTDSIGNQREIVRQLLQKLPESERTVVTLFYLAEMSCEQISQFLGVSQNTIKSRLHRARKRMEGQEHLLNELSGVFHFSQTLSEKISQKVKQIKPATPAVSKTWMPWGLSFASFLLVILMMGMGPRASSRFQQPYNLAAESEVAIEIVNTPNFQELLPESKLPTRSVGLNTIANNSEIGLHSEQFLFASAQVDEPVTANADQKWIQTKGPEGVTSAKLFMTSDKTLYAITKSGLYRLLEEDDVWSLVSTSPPNQDFAGTMAEHNDTFYLLTHDKLLVSRDDGKNWDTLSSRPVGNVVELIASDEALYLILKSTVFRYLFDDVSKTWEPIMGESFRQLQPNEESTKDAPNFRPSPAAWDAFAIDNITFRIWDTLIVDNNLFIGTSKGLYRFTDDWEKLPVPTTHGIKSLAVSEGRLYAGTIAGIPRPKTLRGNATLTIDFHGAEGRQRPPEALRANGAVFSSTDQGDSWNDITPNNREHAMRTVELVSVGDTLILVGYGLSSQDGGKTWISSVKDQRSVSVFPAIALDKNNLYGTSIAGISRSADGGATWHPFTTGIVNSHVRNLITVNGTLYAQTPNGIHSSSDGGESWESVSIESNDEKNPFINLLAQVRVKAIHSKLYATQSYRENVTFFQLSDKSPVFLPVEVVPGFKGSTFESEVQKLKRKLRIKNDPDPEIDKQVKYSLAAENRILEEQRTNGSFAVVDDTIFVEYNHKLYRWRFGEKTWYDTGLENRGVSPIGVKGLIFAASGNIVYAGKREGELSLSKDGGNTWNNITGNLPLSGHFKEILFAGSTVYVMTNIGVMTSSDGESWHNLTDDAGNVIVMDRIAVDGSTAYGVCDSGIYQADKQTNKWEQVLSEVPHTATALAIVGNTFYIGTKHNGVYRLLRANQ